MNERRGKEEKEREKRKKDREQRRKRYKEKIFGYQTGDMGSHLHDWAVRDADRFPECLRLATQKYYIHEQASVFFFFFRFFVAFSFLSFFFALSVFCQFVCLAYVIKQAQSLALTGLSVVNRIYLNPRIYVDLSFFFFLFRVSFFSLLFMPSFPPFVPSCPRNMMVYLKLLLFFFLFSHFAVLNLRKETRLFLASCKMSSKILPKA